MNAPKKHIAVVVEGGVVQSVYSDIAVGDLDVDVVDVDNLAADGFGREQITNIILAATKGLEFHQ